MFVTMQIYQAGNQGSARKAKSLYCDHDLNLSGVQSIIKKCAHTLNIQQEVFGEIFCFIVYFNYYFTLQPLFIDLFSELF